MTDQEILLALAIVRIRRDAAEHERGEAWRDTRTLIREGHTAGIPIAELARYAGVTRQTVYNTIRKERP
jgi:DNA invertase Pin-like site-specific DNA recombinase